jgi:hypothetical protein
MKILASVQLDHTSNMPAGTKAPETGVYVVTHRSPAHTQPHEVFIPRGMVLPACYRCKNVRFSLRSALQLIRQNQFFRPAPPTRITASLRSQATRKLGRSRQGNAG